jgi:hypothetical protein
VPSDFTRTKDGWWKPAALSRSASETKSTCPANITSEPEELGGLGTGGTYNWAGDMYWLYGEVSTNTSLGSFADGYSYNGTAGMRVRW